MKILTILFFLIGFTTTAQNDQFVKMSRDSLTLFVKDTSDYSKEYLEELLNWDLSKTYTLNRDTLIVNGGFGYGLFDTGLKKDRPYIFKGANDLMTINLVATRVNFSTIEYQIELKKGSELNTFNGKAHGGVSILGSESDTDDKTGESYFCSEYSSNWKHSKVIVRIDSEESNKATIIIHDNIHVTLESCPTLVLKE